MKPPLKSHEISHPIRCPFSPFLPRVLLGKGQKTKDRKRSEKEGRIVSKEKEQEKVWFEAINQEREREGSKQNKQNKQIVQTNRKDFFLA